MRLPGRKKPRRFGSGLPTGYLPGYGPGGRIGDGDPFSDSLRAAGIVEDREPRGLAAHKQRVRQRRGRLPQALREGLASVGIPFHDHQAAAEELSRLDGGYKWEGPR